MHQWGVTMPERRAQERKRTQAVVSCRIPATPKFSVIHDISRTGCQVEFLNTRPELGATIILTLAPRMNATGNIVWVDGKKAGIKFVRAISNAALDVIAAHDAQQDGAEDAA